MFAVNLNLTSGELDLVAISGAIRFSAYKHRNQRRKDGAKTPYINHPLEVFDLLVRVGGVRDTAVLMAAILHDCIEDTDATAEEIRAEFGDVVLGYVLELTDDKKLEKAERKRLQVVNAPHKSHGAKLVKLGDKIANISDLGTSPPEGWSVVRRVDYLDFAEKVIAGVRGSNAALEALFDERIAAGRAAIAMEIAAA